MKAWIARDKDGWVGLYRTRPHKGHDECIDGHCTFFRVIDLPEGCNFKWSDKEPIEVQLTIAKK